MVETLKLIPSAFFDVLARLTPGAALLLTLLVIWDTSWQDLAAILFGNKIAESVGASLTLFFAGAYAVGYVLSGPGKIVQRFGEGVDKRWVPIYNMFASERVKLKALCDEIASTGEGGSGGKSRDGQPTANHGSGAWSNDSPTKPVRGAEPFDGFAVPEEVKEEAKPKQLEEQVWRVQTRQNSVLNRTRVRYWRWRVKIPEAPRSLEGPTWKRFRLRVDKLRLRVDKLEGKSEDFFTRWWNGRQAKTGYDYLRSYHPDEGAQCAKIRAEFTMHNAFSAAALISAVAYSVNRAGDLSDNTDWNPWIFSALLAVAVAEAVRGWTTNVTQKSTIVKFMKVRSEAPRTYGAFLATPPPTVGQVAQQHAPDQNDGASGGLD